VASSATAAQARFAVRSGLRKLVGSGSTTTSRAQRRTGPAEDRDAVVARRMGHDHDVYPRVHRTPSGASSSTVDGVDGG